LLGKKSFQNKKAYLRAKEKEQEQKEQEQKEDKKRKMEEEAGDARTSNSTLKKKPSSACKKNLLGAGFSSQENHECYDDDIFASSNDVNDFFPPYEMDYSDLTPATTKSSSTEDPRQSKNYINKGYSADSMMQQPLTGSITFLQFTIPCLMICYFLYSNSSIGFDSRGFAVARQPPLSAGSFETSSEEATNSK
jgi:hypothetical protein